jgi:hypothetical protein
MEFNYKEKNIEVRSFGLRSSPEQNPEHTTAEIVQWSKDAHGKPYCWCAAYWVKEKEGYSLMFVSKRPLGMNPKLFMKMLKIGQQHLDKYFSENF